MKPSKEQTEYIKNAFQKMESKSDFLELLNYSKKICFGKKNMPFEILQLNRYINAGSRPKTGWEVFNERKFRARQNNYNDFKIPKKNGSHRIISAPKPGLKAFQRVLNLILQCVHEPHLSATGFVPKKSIVDNARLHTGQNFVYNLDLKDFFPSIPKSRVWGRLKAKPFNLGSSKNRIKLAGMIAILCTKKTTIINKQLFEVGAETINWKTKDVWALPQGAPTSPTLTNAICDRLDLLLTGVANRFKLNYTRYADDITFSSLHNTYIKTGNIPEPIFQKGSTFDLELRRIIKQQNFSINEAKVRLQKGGYRQEVTGIIVNQKLNVRQSYVKELRSWIYKWEQYGYKRTKSLFNKHFSANNDMPKNGVPELAMVLEGKLLYLKMVKGSKDDTYNKLRLRLDILVTNNNQFQAPRSAKINYIDLIFEIGLEKAMEKYEV